MVVSLKFEAAAGYCRGLMTTASMSNGWRVMRFHGAAQRLRLSAVTASAPWTPPEPRTI